MVGKICERGRFEPVVKEEGVTNCQCGESTEGEDVVGAG